MLFSGRFCRFFVLAALLSVTRELHGEPPDESITAEELKPHVTYLASPERKGRDDWGKIEAGDYIIQHFREFKLQPLFSDEYVQAVPDFSDDSHDPVILGRNIAGFVPGIDPELKREWIIINAHYDHLGIRRGQVYAGADDNASGVSMLLEVARRFAARPGKRSMAFVAFDLEEHRLWGSRWFLAHCPIDQDSIKFCLTADMIGRSLGGLDLPTVFVMGSETSAQGSQALDEAHIPKGLELARLGTDIIGIRSDYGPFWLEQIPFLFFSTGEHPDYHQPTDTIEKLDFAKAAKISTVIGEVARTLSDNPDSLTWEVERAPDLSEVQAVNQVAAHLLAADDAGEFELTNVQRFYVSQVKAKSDYMLKHKKYSASERKWLVRATQLMMYSIF